VQKGPTFIDLFAGIGGLRLGFEAIGAQCVFTSEWDEYSQATYRKNFGDEPIAGDITKISASAIPPHDILLAGFPCQPFSLAGVSKKNSLGRAHGFSCEAQGTLFFEVARILAYHRPRAFVLENVKNLLSHDRGRTFDVIRRVLAEDLGYTVDWRVIDARCVVPQGRQRVFLVGFDGASGFSMNDLQLPPEEEWPTLKAILHPEDGTETPEYPYTRLLGFVEDRYTLTPKLWAYLQAYAKKHREKGNGFGYGLFGSEDVARTLSARYHKDGAEILIRRPGQGAIPRRLTPREAARLMGFDTPTRRWVIPVSDTRAYRQFGNAVVPQVAEIVATAMKPHLMARPALAAA
jgi:DNA (cytosine-5)-methyltransferase 1